MPFIEKPDVQFIVHPPPTEEKLVLLVVGFHLPEGPYDYYVGQLENIVIMDLCISIAHCQIADACRANK